MRYHGHSRADARNLALHRAAFEKLQNTPELMPVVLALLERWLEAEDLAPSRKWLRQWHDLLTTRSLQDVAATVLDPEDGQALRQCTPLAPVLTPRERWAIMDDVNRRFRGDPPSDHSGE